jgi:hypothetical protein
VRSVLAKKNLPPATLIHPPKGSLPAAETMRHFNLSRDYIVRLLNETIAGCEGQDIRNWKSGEQ